MTRSDTAAGRCNVFVAGDGPAGSIAARELALAGLSVAIAGDPARKPPKTGESLPGVGLRLLRSLRMDDSAFGTVHTRIGGNLSCWASKTPDPVDFLRDPDGPGWRLARPRFDADLLAAALAAGARHVKSPVDARWVVDATGRRSAIAQSFGVKRLRDRGLVAVCGFGSAECCDRTVIEAVPEGWWYGAAIGDGAAALVLHVRPRDARAAREDWLEALARTRIMRQFFRTSEGPSFVADAGGSRLEKFYGDGWVACGDAAIAFDPLSSQGVYTALYTGQAAARAIIATDNGDVNALPAYAARLEEIRSVYQARLADSYRQVRRWPNARFWCSVDRAEKD